MTSRRFGTHELVLVSVIVLLITVGGFYFLTRAGSDSTVTYYVTGDGPATISYLMPGGTLAENRMLPWTQTFTVRSTVIDVAVGAQRGAGAGRITCYVTLNGKPLVQPKDANGPYAITSCAIRVHA